MFEAVQASKVVLSFNKVSVLPSDIGRLTKLTILDLRYVILYCRYALNLSVCMLKTVIL